MNHNFQTFEISNGNKLARFFWLLVWNIFFRYSPIFLYKWRNSLLKLFGAKIGEGVEIYPSCEIWAPWNLSIGAHSGIGSFCKVYNVDKVIIKDFVNISQYVYLCTASHSYDEADFPLIISPIVINSHAWVAADAFISMGVKIGEGAIVGARASVFKDVERHHIVGGNPAVQLGIRAEYKSE